MLGRGLLFDDLDQVALPWAGAERDSRAEPSQKLIDRLNHTVGLDLVATRRPVTQSGV